MSPIRSATSHVLNLLSHVGYTYAPANSACYSISLTNFRCVWSPRAGKLDEQEAQRSSGQKQQSNRREPCTICWASAVQINSNENINMSSACQANKGARQRLLVCSLASLLAYGTSYLFKSSYGLNSLKLPAIIDHT